MRLPSTGLAIALAALLVGTLLGPATAGEEPASMGPMGTAMPSADEKIQEVADAKARFGKYDFAGAQKLLETAVKRYPDRLPPVQVIMAAWYGQMNQAGAMIFALEKAILDEPNDPQAYLIFADMELRAGRVTAAALLYNKAHELLGAMTDRPNRKKSMEPEVIAGLAAVAESRASRMGDDKVRANQEWVAAEGYLNAWLKLDPDNAIAMQRLARSLFKQASCIRDEDKEKATQKVKQCYEQLKAAEKADTNVLKAAVQMALFYQEEDDYKNAKRYMDYALDRHKDDLRTLLTATNWCLMTSLEEPGQLEKARELATAAIRVDDKSLEAQILRGVVALYQKKYEEAERYFRAAMLQKPSSFPATNDLALALCEQDDEAKKRRGLEYARMNAQTYQRDRRYAAEAASTYGWVLYKNNQLDKAFQVLSQLIRSGARITEDTLYYAAQVFADRKQFDVATPLVERALESKRPFSMRPEAEVLMKRLRKSTSRR